MIPIGYIYKRVAARPVWIKAPAVDDIYSLSSCVSEDFADYIGFWRHNGYWLFDSPGIIGEVAAANSVSLEGLTLFYYEAYEKQFEADTETWIGFGHDEFPTAVQQPSARTLQGFDVTTFSAQTSPECSPLSCNSLAESIPTNRHCLLETFEEAKGLVERGAFANSEPGPYRIIAVYTVLHP